MKRTFLADRAIYSFAAVALLLGMVLPGLVPAFASASTVETRSIEMSDSTLDKSGVTYNVSFTPSAAFKSVVVDVCSDSPIINTTCTAPAGFAWAASPTVTFTTNTIGTVTATGSSNHLVVGGTTNAAVSAVTFSVAGTHNPTAKGTFYARIITYTDGTASTWTSTSNAGAHVDDGGIALSATEGIGVSAAVREKLTFCVSLATPGSGCSGTTTPNIELGEGSDPKALDAAYVSTGQVWTQISTNASSGAVVRMSNSNNQCGGLHRAGALATVCSIGPVGSGAATATALAPGTPEFGMRLGTATPVGTGTGTLNKLAPYNGASGSYGMQYDSGNTLGVTSPYGDAIYNTNGGPADDMNIDLNFGASINNSTPAGLYSATMNLVATGTF